MPEPNSAEGLLTGASDPLDSGCDRVGLPPVLRKFWVAVVALFVFSALYTFFMIKVVHVGYPYNIPYFHPLSDPYEYGLHWDFTVFTGRFAHFRQPGFWEDPHFYPFTYPAATAVVFAAFYKLPHSAWFYVALCMIAAAIGGWAFAGQLVKRGVSKTTSAAFVLTLLLTSWPLIFLLQRANIEGIVVMLTVGALLAVMGRRWWLAATLIGLAGAMKIFPLVLLGLPLARRRYREFAWGLVVAAAANVASLAILGPSVAEAQRHTTAGLLFFEGEYAAKTKVRDLFFDHSLFTLAKMPLAALYHDRAAGPVMIELKIYTALSAIVGIGLYFLVIRKLPMLNQMLALSLCAVMLPPVSFDYTLPHLFVPFCLLCLYATEEWRRNRELSPGLAVCFAMFALIFTDLQWVNLYIRLSGQARAVAMTGLLIMVLRFHWSWDVLDGPERLVE